MRDNISKEELEKIYFGNTNEDASEILGVSKVTLIKFNSDIVSFNLMFIFLYPAPISFKIRNSFGPTGTSSDSHSSCDNFRCARSILKY